MSDESNRFTNQLLYGVNTDWEATLARMPSNQPHADTGPNPAYGAGIGNLSGWVVFFGAVGLILAGIATRSWIGGALGALAFAAFPTGIAMLTGKFRPSLPRLGAKDGAAKQRKPASLLFWVALFTVLGGLAAVGFAYAIEAPDAVMQVAPVLAGAGALLGLVVWTVRRLSRRSAK